MKPFARVGLLLSALLLAAAPCLAAGTQGGMQFIGWTDKGGVKWGAGQRDYIFGDGEIVSETPAALQEAMKKYKAHQGTILVLNSPGGDVAAALKMGRMIRAAKLSTNVGNFLPTYVGLSPNLDPQLIPFVPSPLTPPFPGYCYSSCTLMLLGGVVRNIRPSSDYGVHRFSYVKTPDHAADMAQIDTAAIVAYLDEMGISPGFLTEMVKKGSDDVTHLTVKQLVELRVLTPKWTTDWHYSLDPGPQMTRFFLEGVSNDQWGKHEISFRCPWNSETRSTGAYVMLNVALNPGGRVDPNDYVRNISDYIMELDQASFAVDSKAIWGTATVTSESHRIEVTVELTRDDIALMEKSKHLGLAFLNSSADVGILQLIATIDPTMLSQFAQQCPPPAVPSAKSADSIKGAHPTGM